MDKNSYEQWIKIRAQGKMRYVLKTGLLKFSLPFGIIVALYIAIAFGSKLYAVMTFQDLVITLGEFLLLILIVGIPVGILYGLAFWWMKERQYKQYKDMHHL